MMLMTASIDPSEVRLSSSLLLLLLSSRDASWLIAFKSCRADAAMLLQPGRNRV
jgi:hypothetical protein